jgi:NADH-quinone oxidoreductase subunit N
MFVSPDLIPLSAEIFVLVMACVVMVADLYFADKTHRVTYLLTQLTLVVAIFITANGMPAEATKTVLYGGSYVVDYMAGVLKIGIYIASIVSLIYARDYIAKRNFLHGEYYMLALFAVLGMMVMVSAHSMLTIYLGLELLSLPLYAMVAMERDNSLASEAAMKYFVMGAIASGFLLYGMSLLYGATGSLNIEVLNQSLSNVSENAMMVNFGVVFIVAGLAFKLGAVPFHMWLPDVYHGSPTAVTLFIGSAPKIAAFGMVIRLLTDGLAGLSSEWQPLLIVLALMSMVAGNVIAIAQDNLKRLLAYSTIGHVGFFLLGILSGTTAGYAASMYYILVYAIMTLAGFGMIVYLSRVGFESDRISDFKGLAKRSPWSALMMLFTLMSLAGVPPFIGFWPKLEVIKQAIAQGYVGISVFAVVFSFVAAFYYLKVAKAMYFDEPEEEVQSIEAASDVRLLVTVNGLSLLVLGLMPGWLLEFCLKAFA